MNRLTISMNQVSGKENIKMANRLLFEKDVIKAVDKHMNDDSRLDNDISCILEELKSPIIVDLKEAMNNFKIENKPIQKQRRVLLFENENLDLEQRGNKYYLSLYDTIGRFKKEVTIDMKDDILEILSREDCYGNI